MEKRKGLLYAFCIAIGITLLVFLILMGVAGALSDAEVSNKVTLHDSENGLEIFRIDTASDNIIDSCTEVSDPGEYILGRDIDNQIAPNTYWEICINISSNDVIINGAGHKISNSGMPEGTAGLYAESLSNITIINLSVYNWGSGILFSNVKNGKIIENSPVDNINGILLSSSFNNTLDGNKVTWNWYGIHLDLSDNNTMINNIASSNHYEMWWDWNNYYDEGYGIYLYGSNNNTLKGNNASENYFEGIYLSENSNYNKIYWNNIINNMRDQAISYSLNNYWDSGYPGGGNYWSDYTGSDINRGSNQNIPGGDGIGDTPYIISGGIGAQDSYPLMAQYIKIKGDVDRDGIITAADALLYLRYAVHQNIAPYQMSTSDDVTCDGNIFADDALLVLRKAVNQPVDLVCPRP